MNVARTQTETLRPQGAGAPRSPGRALARARRRSGLTLVELLVTIAIVLAISAVALPLLAPNAAGRQQREAVRSLSAFINAARTRAIELGRPAGVWIEGLPGNHETVASIANCEVPLPYAGQSFQSRCRILVDPALGIGAIQDFGYYVGTNWNSEGATGIRLMDTIQLGHHGTKYRITSGQPDPDPVRAAKGFLDSPSTTNPWIFQIESQQPFPAPGEYPFLIHRAPVKSALNSFELPAGTVLNLDFSGDDLLPLHPVDDEDDASYWVSTGSGWAAGSHEPHRWVEERLDGTINPLVKNEPIIILFGPNGAIDSVYCFVPFKSTSPTAIHPAPADADSVIWLRQEPIGPIYFLVGKSENSVEGAPVDSFRDLFDADNQWVSIDPTTGITRSTEVNVPNDAVEQTFLTEVRNDDLQQDELRYLLMLSRSFLMEGEGRGGQ